MHAVRESMALAEELGVVDTFVFFNDWVPYADRWRYLIEADVGLSTHHDHLETALSFRTRMLDYLWAGVPIVCTAGDVFASLVKERKLGLVVGPGDVEELAAAIERLVDDRDERARCRLAPARTGGGVSLAACGRAAGALLRCTPAGARRRTGAKDCLPSTRSQVPDDAMDEACRAAPWCAGGPCANRPKDSGPSARRCSC